MVCKQIYKYNFKALFKMVGTTVFDGFQSLCYAKLSISEASYLTGRYVSSMDLLPTSKSIS